MTPETIQERKAKGLQVTQQDVFWLLDLCETLAKALTGLAPDRDFRCVVCGEEEHGDRCSVRLGEAVLEGRWKVNP